MTQTFEGCSGGIEGCMSEGSNAGVDLGSWSDMYKPWDVISGLVHPKGWMGSLTGMGLSAEPRRLAPGSNVLDGSVDESGWSR